MTRMWLLFPLPQDLTVCSLRFFHCLPKSMKRKPSGWNLVYRQSMMTPECLHEAALLMRLFKKVSSLHALSIKVIVHLILGLPHETREMMSASVQAIANLPVWGIKLQLLHVLSGTDLAAYYEKTHFPVFSMNEYCEMIIDCLELLPPEMVIHRITGDGPKDLLIAPMWSTGKRTVLNQIHRRLKERNTYQGRLATKR